MIEISDKITELKKKIERNNEKFYLSLTREEQKKIGQFTTPIPVADFIAERLIKNSKKLGSKISILDPGAGTGVLGLALVEKLFDLQQNKMIRLVTFENDPVAGKVLSENLRLARDYATNCNIDFDFEINSYDYILGNDRVAINDLYIDEASYDFVIANPPYKKLRKNSPEAELMDFVVHGAPNAYGFFWAKSTIELKKGAISGFIMPRSWMSGAYFARLRHFMFKLGSLCEIHSFDERKNAFGSTNVLQELVIVLFKKQNIDKIKYFYHNNINDLTESAGIFTATNMAIVGDEQRVYNIATERDRKSLLWTNQFSTIFQDAGLKMRTGLTVSFRNRALLRDKLEDNAVPIFYSDNFKDRLVYMDNSNSHYLLTNHKGLLQTNQDYIFVKRFSTKEEHRRVQVAYFESDCFKSYRSISTDNKLNFVTADDQQVLLGAFIMLASTQFDRYYRLISGNTQVNSTEINTMKFPNKYQLIRLIMEKSVTEILNLKQDQIDSLVEQFFPGGLNE